MIPVTTEYTRLCEAHQSPKSAAGAPPAAAIGSSQPTPPRPARVCSRWQVHQHRARRRPLHQGVDRGMSRLGDDEITLPMPGTARSSASADRSEMLTISQIRFLRCPASATDGAAPGPCANTWPVHSAAHRATANTATERSSPATPHLRIVEDPQFRPWVRLT
jgi:hypothetical protein